MSAHPCPRCGVEAVARRDAEMALAYCFNDACEDMGRFAVLPLRTDRFTRADNCGTCQACDVGLYEDGETVDTHAPGCTAVERAANGREE